VTVLAIVQPVLEPLAMELDPILPDV